MNASEATALLTVISATDPRIEVNQATALSWSWLLDDMPIEVARTAYAALVDAGETGRITPPMIKRYARPYMHRLATDVRSAKLRHLIPEDWPATRPLPAAAAAALAAEWAANNDPDALHGAAPRPELEP